MSGQSQHGRLRGRYGHPIFWTAALLTLQLVFGYAQEAGSGPAQAQAEAAPPSRKTVHSLQPYLDPRALYLRSDVALVLDEETDGVLYEKNVTTRRPIASLTKLMTAMVVLDAGLPGDEVITITKDDRDRLRGSDSRLSFGTKLTRRDLLKIALAGSDNRAAAALGRTFPGGTKAMVVAMNRKAEALGMAHTEFQDPAGLRSGNLSTAGELAALAEAASRYPMIRNYTTLKTDFVTDQRTGWKIHFVNTNRLVRNGKWEIGLSKTGYIADAGHCLVMRVALADRPVTVVLLNSWGTLTKYGDANRIRAWLNRADEKARKARSLVASAGPAGGI
ncbi:MAG: serine hydrolase [Nitrospirota bacterium]